MAMLMLNQNTCCHVLLGLWKIKYLQEGKSSVFRTGDAAASASWVVARFHPLAVLVVVFADVAEVSGEGLHRQRTRDLPALPLDDHACHTQTGGEQHVCCLQSEQHPPCLVGE